MEKILNDIDEIINEIKKYDFIFKDKLEYINKNNIDIIKIINFKLGDLIEFFLYTVFPEKNNCFTSLVLVKKYLNEYELDNNFLILIDELLEKNININVNNDPKNELNKINLSEDSRNIIRKIFVKYNSSKTLNFLYLFNNKNIKMLIVLIEEMLSVKASLNLAKKLMDTNCNIELQKIKKVLLKNLKLIPRLLELLNKSKKRLNDDNIKFNKGKIISIKQLENIKKLINQKKYVDISKYESFLNEKMKFNLRIYNNEVLTDEMKEEQKKRQKLACFNMNNLDYFIKINKFNLIETKINNTNAINILKIINEKFPFLKEYSNILYYILDYSDASSLKKIYMLLDNKTINNEFILNNYEKTFNEFILNNLILNINLLNKYKLDTKLIINYDNNILFIDNKTLSTRMEKYEKYNIDFNKGVKYFEFLLQDNYYIIDLFIEIGLFDFIKNNPNYIACSSNNIIKRIILFKELNNNYLNESEKLKGVITNENKSIINNKELNEVIVYNYEDFINKEITLENKNYDMNITEIHELNDYVINDFAYKIGDLIISKNKVLRNINILYNSEYQLSREEILFYALIYNYPKYLTNNDINCLYNVLGIKRKLKEI